MASSWQSLKPGVEFKELKTEVNESPVSIHVLKVNLTQAKIRPIAAEKNLTAKRLAEKSGALAVINANFFDTEGKVLGLVKKDGKIINPLKKISWWSVFCANNYRAKIIHTTQYVDSHCQQAIQAGPRLVVDGAVPRLKDELSRKTAVAINGQGEVLFIVSKQHIPIKNFAQVVILPEKKGWLGCRNAIYFDGGGSSQLYIAGANSDWNISSLIEVPVGLGVFAK